MRIEQNHLPRSASRRRRMAPALAVLGVLLVSSIGLSFAAADRPEPRTVTLVARDMAFYLEGDPTPNPRLVFGQGESLRITLRNEDRGMTHDLVLDGAGVGGDRATEALRVGESATLELRMPDQAGELAYLCSFHPQMMRSVLAVQ